MEKLSDPNAITLSYNFSCTFSSGITGAAFHHVVAPNPGRGQEPTTETADDSGLMQGFVIEFALAILFIFALFTVLFGQEKCCVHAQAAPWKIGLIYTLCLLIDVSASQRSVNQNKIKLVSYADVLQESRSASIS